MSRIADNTQLHSDRPSIPSIWLLLSLLVSLIVVPLLEQQSFGDVVLRISFTITITLTSLALWKRRVLRVPVVVLATVTIPFIWAVVFVESTFVFVAQCLLGSAFFWLVGGVLLSVVIRRQFASLDSIFGAISAYLLFGLAWSLTYWAIDYAAPGSFIWPKGELLSETRTERYSEFIYYSMVTMSTLGYGDVTPTNSIARTLAWMQSMAGQFYVAVLVAWLVGALPRRDEPSRKSSC
jgi:voltage-gated potassium channel